MVFIAFSFISQCRSKKAKLKKVGEQTPLSGCIFQDTSELKPVDLKVNKNN